MKNLSRICSFVFQIARLSRARVLAIVVLLTFVSVFASNSCRKTISSLFSTERLTSSYSELPESAVLIALGLDSQSAPLGKFARNVENHLNRKVVTYRGFSKAHYITQNGEWWAISSYDHATSIVESVVRKAVNMYPGKKVIAFNLEGFDPQKMFGQNGEVVESYTNFEARLLLQERNLFLATRWYLNGRELSLEEAEKFWKSALDKL